MCVTSLCLSHLFSFRSIRNSHNTRRMSSQLPWEWLEDEGVDPFLTSKTCQQLLRTTSTTKMSDGTTMQMIDELSSVLSFHVGDGVSRGSWGKRFYRKHSHQTLSSQQQKQQQGYWVAQHFSWEEVVGSGHFGVVYKANYRGMSCERVRRCTNVAIKCFSKQRLIQDAAESNRSLELLQREVSIHSSLAHESIVQFHGFYEDSVYFNIVLDYVPAGDLLEYMHHHCPLHSRRRVDIARTVLRQVASALSYLNAIQVSHRDIKPENILIRNTKTLSCALTDFGWACWWKHGEYRKTLCGTPEYVPMEMISGPRRYEAAYVDCWALGVLTCELLNGTTPFAPTELEQGADAVESISREVIFDKIRSFQLSRLLLNNPTSSSSTSTTIPSTATDFCMQLMQEGPTERLTATMALEHVFLQLAPTVTPTTRTPSNRPTVAQRCQLFQPQTTSSR